MKSQPFAGLIFFPFSFALSVQAIASYSIKSVEMMYESKTVTDEDAWVGRFVMKESSHFSVAISSTVTNF